MSGPKVMSVEEIRRTEEEREQLRQEQARREERMRLVQARFRKAEVLARQIGIAGELQAALLPVLEEPGAADLAANLAALERANRQAVDAWPAVEASDDNEALQRHVAGLDAAIGEAEKRLSAARHPIEAMRMAYFDRMMKRVERQPGVSAQPAPAADVPEALLEGESRRLLGLLEDLRSRAGEADMDRAPLDALEGQVRQNLSDRNRERWMILEELHRIDVFRLRPFQAALERREAENDALDAELSEALAQYHSLCSLYRVEPRRFPFRRESLAEIRCACGDLMERFRQAEDCGAILERVQAALTGLGYRFLGEKEEDRRILRQVYRIHDRTVLHVVFDSTGRVTMEVGIEDDVDRLPYAREIGAIVEEQGAFCRAFEGIRQSLDGQGLTTRKELLCPCGAEYAQIINTSGFAGKEAGKSFDYGVYASRRRKYSREGAR